MSEVLFPRIPEYRNLGRNGLSFSKGLQVQRLGEEIVFRPINSRDEVAKCQIVIPVEMAQAVAAMLLAEASTPAEAEGATVYTYTVVERAGYEGECVGRAGFSTWSAANDWMIDQYGEPEDPNREKMRPDIRMDGSDGSQTYEC